MDSKKIFGLFGTGGFAREIMPLVRPALLGHYAHTSDFDICFVDRICQPDSINGYKVLSEDQFFSFSGEKYFNIAIADSKIREKLATICKSKNIKPFALHADNAVIYEYNTIDEGSILCTGSVITSNATIGAFFHSNLSSYVAHDCVIGDYVTFAPNVSCNGNVHIGNHAYVGTGAVIKQGTDEAPLTIGEGAVIGMGTVVTKSVAPYTTVVGNPARLLEKKAYFNSSALMHSSGA